MSPLVCSLLALASLLAVATALTEPDPYCGELILGIRTDDSRYFELKGTGGLYNIGDRCKSDGDGTKRVGQDVVVCNEPNSKPKIYQIDNLDVVSVDCPNNTYGCENVTVKVTQYCDPVGPQIKKVAG